MNIKLYNALQKLCIISLVGGGTSIFAMNNDKKRSIEEVENVDNNQLTKKQKFDEEFFDAFDLLMENESEFLKKDFIRTMDPEELDYCYARLVRYVAYEEFLKIVRTALTPLMKAIIQRDENRLENIKILLAQKEKVSGDHIYCAMELRLHNVVELLLTAVDHEIVRTYNHYQQGLVSLALELENCKLDGIIVLLIKMGCTVSNADILLLIENYYVEVFSYIVNYMDMNMSLNQRSLLSHCIMTQNPELVKLVVKQGARITQRDIVDNYVIGVHACDLDDLEDKIDHYELTNDCYTIASLLGGTFPQDTGGMAFSAPEKYEKLLQDKLYQQFNKDYMLVHYLELLDSDDTNDREDAIESIKKLLQQGADPKTSGCFSHGQKLFALEMALQKQCQSTVFNLLLFGASLDVVLSNDTFEIDDYTVTIQKILLGFFWIRCLQVVPALYGVPQKNELKTKLYYPFLSDVQLTNELLKFTPMLNKLCNTTAPGFSIDWKKPEKSITVLHFLFKDGSVLNQLSKSFGFQESARYLLQYPKAAELLLLHSPYRQIESKDKNEQERWYINIMKQQKNQAGNSAYHGFLLLGNNRLLDKIKNSHFIDTEFRFKE